MKIVSTEPGAERVTGAPVLRRVERIFRAADAAFSSIPRSLDPMSQTGAVANTTILVAIATGIALLLWYVPSVTKAYDSVLAMHGRFDPAGIVRSVHRYSSDAAMLFVLLHAVRVTAEQRFGGARWVAWVTGLASLGFLWFIGWLGYWLVWDEPAQEVALATARLVDVVPVFADSLSRTFLTDDSINSLIFFIVFFAHMLLPLGMGIGLWLHISRLRRSKFLAPRKLTIAVVVSLVAISLIAPAPLGDRAAMALTPDGYPMDGWYLAPLMLAERLGAAQLWLVLLVTGTLVGSVPWLLVRKVAEKAVVDPSKCDECLKCVADCPYGAISMVPRAEPNPRRPTTAWVDPVLCVGCTICSGSCDSSGIGVSSLPAPRVRLKTDGWMNAEAEPVVYLCTPSRPADLEIDAGSGHSPQVPGARIVAVPCAGWVHPLTIERAIRKGAPAVVVVGCPDGACRYREGGATLEQRVRGERLPALRTDHVDPERVTVVREPAVSSQRLVRIVEAARQRRPIGRPRLPAPVAATIGLLLLSVILIGFSNIPWSTSYSSAPGLVVAIKHPGQLAEQCRQLDTADQSNVPVHMRQPQQCERRRADIRVRVTIDGEVQPELRIEPKGLSGDGVALGMLHYAPGLGQHHVVVEVADGNDASDFNYRSAQTIDLALRERAVVRFERGQFRWSDHGE